MSSGGQKQRRLYRDFDREKKSVLEVMSWFLDFQNSWPAIQRCKQSMLENLRPTNGQTALDAGCGLGDDTRFLAARVAPDGYAIGVDASEAMITAAHGRTSEAEPQPDFRVADVNALPFSNDTFDVVRCERTFQWLDTPDQAFAELVRVTKPGGRVAVMDGDWTSAIWDWGDTELSTRLLDAHRSNLPNPEAGRRLPALFRHAGLADIQTDVHLALLDSPMIDAMQRNDIDLLFQPILNDDEWVRFVDARDAAIRTGTAYSTIILFMVAGSKPI